MRDRSRLDELARRIERSAASKDLVLPKSQLDSLHQIEAHARERATAGCSVLFRGGSGAGKTLAADVLAEMLQLDLYRVDLSQVISKYIGETEKNLQRLFAAAEDSGAILFFDEADSLFGKRSEVKDSHDRYANQEINYLLQRTEARRGLVIVATNGRTAVDPALLRRFRFIVELSSADAGRSGRPR